MSSPSPQVRVIHLWDDTFGAYLVGAYLVIALWGMSCVQFYNYFAQSFNNDRPAVKCIMIFVAIVNTFSACLSAHIPYHYLIVQYAKPVAATHLTWSIPVAMICAELSNFIIRGLYARRVWILSRGNVWLTGLICILSLPNFAMCTASAFILLFRLKSVLDFFTPRFLGARRLFNAEFAMNIAVEVAITGAMCYYLFQSRTAFAKTNTVVNMLIKYAISTGLLHCVRDCDGTALDTTHDELGPHILLHTKQTLHQFLPFHADDKGKPP